jgi:hypothetical protein
MKIELKAIVEYTWTEDSEDWPQKPQTKEELIELVKEYCTDDYSYFVDADPILIKLTEA